MEAPNLLLNYVLQHVRVIPLCCSKYLKDHLVICQNMTAECYKHILWKIKIFFTTHLIFFWETRDLINKKNNKKKIKKKREKSPVL